jgi:hypothetical protein
MSRRAYTGLVGAASCYFAQSASIVIVRAPISGLQSIQVVESFFNVD